MKQHMKVQQIAAVIAVAGAAAAIVIAGPLLAGGLSTPPVRDPAVAKECSACHMLYPAGLLPARSWSRLVAGLENHFGENAQLEPELAQRISAYLTENAADQAGRNSKVLRGLPSASTPLRITELPWWLRKHDKRDRVAPATLLRKGAKFKGDCAACHQDAEKGYFEDD